MMYQLSLLATLQKSGVTGVLFKLAKTTATFVVGVVALSLLPTAIGQDAGAEHQDVAVSVNPGGMQQFVPGRWSMMSVSGLNHSDDDSEELVVVQLGDDIQRQYARRLWIPANSRRQAWMPIQIDAANIGKKRIDMSSIRLKDDGQNESFQANVVGEPISKRSLRLSKSGSQTAVLSGAPRSYGPVDDKSRRLVAAIYDIRDACAIDFDQSELANYRSSFLPPHPQAFDTLDQLVLTSDYFLNDSTSVDRIGQWLRAGGKLWVMVDQMSTESLLQLFNNNPCFTSIDRVELNEFEIHQLNRETGESFMFDRWQGDQPIEMVRGIAKADQVICTIDGWPALFTKQVGKGEVLFSTLDVGALIADHSPLISVRTAFDDFFVPPLDDPRHAAVMQPLVDTEIGYRIPTRGIVMMVLGTQWLLVLAIGIWLAKQRSLDRMAIVIPISVAVATASLVWMGKRNAGEIPPTFASGQFAQVILGGSEVLVDSISAIYSNTKQPVQLTASPRTKMSLQDATHWNNTRQLWTDNGNSQWMHLTQPPGVVRHINSESHIRLDQPWTFHCQFDETGFVGQLAGPAVDRCQDAVIVSNTAPALALSHRDGHWVGSADDILSPGQFFSGSLLTEQQRQRQTVLRGLLSNEKRLFGRTPTLLFWTDAQDFGLKIGEPFVQRGSALVAMPLQFDRPASGSPFRVPANFVRMEVAATEKGFSTLYNPQTGQWLQERTKAQSTLLNCFPPSSLLPCELRSATIQLKMSAPSRTLQISVRSAEEDILLHRESNPNGLIEIKIDDPQSLSLTDEGALGVRIDISQTTQEQSATETSDSESLDDQDTGLDSRVWQIDFLHIAFDGVTQ